MATLSTLGSMMLALPPQIQPYNQQELTANRIQLGNIQNRTSLLDLAELQRQLGTQAAARQYQQQHPETVLGGPMQAPSPTLASPTLTQGPAGALTQGPLAGMPGTAQTVPAYPDLSQFATGQAPAQPPSPLASLGAARHPLEALVRRNPDAARLVMAQQQQQEAQQLTRQDQLLKGRMHAYGAVAQLLQGAKDQATYEPARARVAQIFPDLAAQLPQMYSKDAVQPWLDQALSRKEQATLEMQRLQRQVEGQRKVGLTPVWGTDAQGNPALIQLSSTGEAVSPQLPPGFKPQPGGVGKMDLGTTVAIYDRSGNIIGYQQKDIAGQEREQVRGRQEGERPQLAKKAQDSLAQMDIKRSALLGDPGSGQEGDIDRAIRLANEGWFTTGRMGELAASFGVPQAVDLEEILATIGTNVGFDELRDIKASGGTLGAVSDFENRQLQSVLGSLRQRQSREQLVRNLTRLKTLLTESRQRRQEAYQRDFGDLKPVGEMSMDELRAERERLRSQGGR